MMLLATLKYKQGNFMFPTIVLFWDSNFSHSVAHFINLQGFKIYIYWPQILKMNMSVYLCICVVLNQ